jgi:hypothetical protein
MNNDGTGRTMTDSDFDELVESIDSGEFDFAVTMIEQIGSELAEDDVTMIMGILRGIDPTFSGPVAAVRDALRDNTSYTIL